MLDNSLQLFNRNISSTSEKYRLLQKNIEIFQKEYRVLQKNTGFLHMFSLSGLLQLLRKYLGSCPQVLAFCRFRQRQGHALPGARARLDPASKLQFVLIPGADLVKEAF